MPRRALVQLRIGVNGQKIQVNAVVKSVSLVPHMLVYGEFQFLRRVGIPCRVDSKPFAYVLHCFKLLVHKAVEVYRCGAAVRAVEGTGVVIHSYCGIVVPEKQTRFLMIKIAEIEVKKFFRRADILAQPLRVTAVTADNKRRMLHKARLVYI